MILPPFGSVRSEEFFLTLCQASKKLAQTGLQVGPQTLIRWATVGIKTATGERVKLKARKWGGRWVTTDKDLAEFSRALTAKSEVARTDGSS